MYYVLCTNCYESSTIVRRFETREEAVAFMLSLPDDYYMITLRNDDYAVKRIDRAD